jgi:hypothetical protein
LGELPARGHYASDHQRVARCERGNQSGLTGYAIGAEWRGGYPRKKIGIEEERFRAETIKENSFGGVVWVPVVPITPRPPTRQREQERAQQGHILQSW